jgi:hypothetical protein
VTEYNKYKCIRNILSHKEGDKLHKNTMEAFKQYFRPIHDTFDFKHCDVSNRIIIFDSDSSKTKRTLEKVDGDLISEVRKILKL